FSLDKLSEEVLSMSPQYLHSEKEETESEVTSGTEASNSLSHAPNIFSDVDDATIGKKGAQSSLCSPEQMIVDAKQTQEEKETAKSNAHEVMENLTELGSALTEELRECASRILGNQPKDNQVASAGEFPNVEIINSLDDEPKKEGREATESNPPENLESALIKNMREFSSNSRLADSLVVQEDKNIKNETKVVQAAAATVEDTVITTTTSPKGMNDINAYPAANFTFAKTPVGRKKKKVSEKDFRQAVQVLSNCENTDSEIVEQMCEKIAIKIENTMADSCTPVFYPSLLAFEPVLSDELSITTVSTSALSCRQKQIRAKRQDATALCKVNNEACNLCTEKNCSDKSQQLMQLQGEIASYREIVPFSSHLNSRCEKKINETGKIVQIAHHVSSSCEENTDSPCKNLFEILGHHNTRQAYKTNSGGHIVQISLDANSRLRETTDNPCSNIQRSPNISKRPGEKTDSPNKFVQNLKVTNEADNPFPTIRSSTVEGLHSQPSTSSGLYKNDHNVSSGLDPMSCDSPHRTSNMNEYMSDEDLFADEESQSTSLTSLKPHVSSITASFSPKASSNFLTAVLGKSTESHTRQIPGTPEKAQDFCVPSSPPLSQTGKKTTRRGLCKKDSPFLKLLSESIEDVKSCEVVKRLEFESVNESFAADDRLCLEKSSTPKPTNLEEGKKFFDRSHSVDWIDSVSIVSKDPTISTKPTTVEEVKKFSEGSHRGKNSLSINKYSAQSSSQRLDSKFEGNNVSVIKDFTTQVGVKAAGGGSGTDVAVAVAAVYNLEKDDQLFLQATTPSQSKGHNRPGWRELSPFSPMPQYNSMDTPALKKAVEKIGVRPVGKKRMRELLEEVYRQTHQ
ncbi:hypothetical protein RRG08_063122, partial [Elysia crispata]